MCFFFITLKSPFSPFSPSLLRCLHLTPSPTLQWHLPKQLSIWIRMTQD
jgi:hypothetical protein